MIRYGCFAALLAGACCFGCGPRNNPTFEKTVPVRGSVARANGAILPGGLITFHPRDPAKGEARGTIGADGRFELGTYKINDGAMPGAYTVTIDPIVFDQRGNPRRNRSLAIPPSYTDAQASPLTVEVKDEGAQDIQIVLR